MALAGLISPDLRLLGCIHHGFEFRKLGCGVPIPERLCPAEPGMGAHEVGRRAMPAGGCDTEIEGAFAVTQSRTLFPTRLCHIGVLRPALSKHGHPPKMGKSIGIARRCSPFEQAPGVSNIAVAAKPVQIHEAEIELGGRNSCGSGHSITGPRVLQISLRSAAMVQQHAKIVCSARMPAIGRLPQKPDCVV